MKIAFVTPRYGVEVVGGAEHAARMLAERLVSQLDWSVEAYSSCAIDSATWENVYDPGLASINGVTVRRFATTQPRHRDFLKTSELVHRQPEVAPMSDQQRWIDQQGPQSPELVTAIGQSDAEVTVFYPYLYYPTVRGLPRVRGRSVLHPAAHDEAAIRMPVFRPVFGGADGLVFQTEGERQLVERIFPVADRPQLLFGLGVDPLPSDDQQSARRTLATLGDRPYVLCLGRVDEGKGARLLATYFAEYKLRRPGPLALVFVGPVVQQPEFHPDVVVAGVVTDNEKWGALRGARVLISPSPYEAFSLALIEGWAAGRPALVNAACLATREHVERSSGGLWFDGYLSFESALDRLLNHYTLSRAMASAGNRYVEDCYGWPALIERYGQFLQQIVARPRKQTRTRQEAN